MVIREAKYAVLFKVDARRVPRQSIWLIPRTHQGPQDSGKARERDYSLLRKKKSSTKKYLYLDRAIGDNNTFFNFSAMDWSLPYRHPFLYRKRSNVPRNKNSPLAIVSRLRENCNPRQRFLQCVFPQL